MRERPDSRRIAHANRRLDEASKLAEDAYRNGQGEIQSVLRSREKRLQLSAAKLDALREFHLARVRHESALGKP